MRVCLVYDCLFPHTVGGAERWYRNLAQRLAAEGHEVTYLTLRQWDRGTDPGVPGVDVRVVGPRMRLYAGARTPAHHAAAVFGPGCSCTCCGMADDTTSSIRRRFPYFSLLAATAARPRCRYRLLVDWHEVWTRDTGASTSAIRPAS